MGCTESRFWPRSCSHKQTDDVINEPRREETKSFLEDVKEPEGVLRPEETETDTRSLTLLPVSEPVLELAQKMSQDIVAQALQLFWEVEIQYNNLPFIDMLQEFSFSSQKHVCNMLSECLRCCEEIYVPRHRQRDDGLCVRRSGGVSSGVTAAADRNKQTDSSSFRIRTQHVTESVVSYTRGE
ncbi:unnamed protein product [Pleuronectes platessa]|uniref:Uncharacterized protein n=1 Tax=Pleuronectes platessa TaxID=8262 RepID=A0A9N7UQK6_PLEPL|nr:unnamed protein product [Pleuronectes platessa]